MIKAENITKSFDGHEVLKGISATFDRGKTNLIIGRSGSGKTVLMKCLVGLLKPEKGEIWYDDVCFSRLGIRQLKAVRQQMGMIFQGGALLDSSTVEENIRLPLDMFTDKTEAEKRDRVDFCLERVALKEANKLYPSELSGGMIKRVAIARAIVMNPKYLFCDEPNSGLDPITAGLIDQLIGEITHEYGMTTVMNTHDMHSVVTIGEKIIFLHDGTKHWEGTRDEVLNSGNPELEEFMSPGKR